jgi:hypothetical protein
VNEKDVKIEELFTEENFSVEQLKERRSLACTLIDEKAANHYRKMFYVNRKLTLLTKVRIQFFCVAHIPI